MNTLFSYQIPDTVKLDTQTVTVPPDGSAHDLMRIWNFSLTHDIAQYNRFILSPGDKIMAVFRPEIIFPIDHIIAMINSLRGEINGQVYVGSPSVVVDLLSFKHTFPNTETGNLYALGEKIFAPGGVERFVFARPKLGVPEVSDCGVGFHPITSDAFLVTLYRQKNILAQE